MQRAVRSVAVVLGGLLAMVMASQAQPSTSLAAIASAMGADTLRTVAYAGDGYTFAFQQAPGPGEPWPLFIADVYRMDVDYRIPAIRTEFTRAQGEKPPRGGAGQPVAGNPRSIQYLRESVAWSQTEQGQAMPSPGAVVARQRQLWTTPHGLVKVAQQQKAPMTGRTFPVTIAGQAMTVTAGSDNLIEKVDYRIDSPVLGDVPVQMVFSDYRDVDGVKVPMHLIEKTDGYLTLDIAVKDVAVNPPLSFEVPPAMASAAPADMDGAPRVDATLLAPGVWHVIASGYGSMLVEFKDFLLMFEGPIDDARTLAVNEWARRTVPGKPLRYVVNTHAHFDHAGGLRAYAAEGITIIAHEMNRSYFEQVWQRPRTLKPDLLARQPRTPVWETMTERKTVTDGSRVLELHKLVGNGHNPYILIGYLPAEKLLLYGDMYNPPAGSDPRDVARTNEYADNLYDNIANRLKLDVQTIVPVHGRAVPLDNLRKAIGLIPLDQ